MHLSAHLRAAPPGARAPGARAASSQRRALLARYSQEPAAGAAKRERDEAKAEDDDPLLDLLRSAVPLATLDRTEEALAEYCGGKGPQHLEVLQYYREKRAAAQRGCMLELEAAAAAAPSSPSPSPSPACAALAQLERLLHETSYSGDAAHLYRVLAAQRATEARQQQQHEAAPSSSSADTNDADGALLRARAVRLFHLIDANGDGRVDREEFLSAMRVMDAELSDAELGAVFSALDAGCALTADQFVDAVLALTPQMAALAEASVDDTPEGGGGEDEGRRGQAFLKQHVRRHSPDGTPSASDADVLRRVRHSRPTWWSDAPGYLDNSS